MKNTFIAALPALIALLLIPSAAPAAKPDLKQLTRQLMFSAVYVKETSDRPWQLRIAGDLPRGPGLCALVYDEEGTFLKRAEIPWGAHTDRKPFVINIPADGKAQQYVIKMLGQQDNLNGMRLPLTNLPYEVYGDNYFAFGQGVPGATLRLAAFQPNADGKPIHFSGWSDHYRILDADGNPVIDSKDAKLADDDPRKKGGPRYYETIVTLEPGKTYWIDPYRIMYLGSKDANLYVTFDPKRWFEPKLTWTLQSRPWWKGTVDVD